MFTGSIVALVTPMQADGTIDYKAVAELLDWHIEAKTNALVIAGTTGESATLSPEEQLALIAFCVKHVNGRLPIIAGSGTNATHTTIKLSENAKQAGADACLIVTPYYNKPTQQGLYEHYKTVAAKVSLPIILYNVPGRTACDLLPETVERLSHIPHIIGIKEATGKLDRAKIIQDRCHADFAIFSGDDATALALIKQGAKGVISVTANVAPAKMAQLCQAALEQDFQTAEKLDQALSLLHQRLFVEANPIPVKWALSQMGKISDHLRLPLLPLDKAYHQTVKEAMQHAEVH